MKTKLDIRSKAKPIKFPLLARTMDLKPHVVLFASENSGTVVEAGLQSVWTVGHYSSEWIKVTDATRWTILPPGSSVTLTQE